MIRRLLLSTLGIALSALPAPAQSDRVVALVVSVGAGAARADAIQAQLQVMGAETLRSESPNNAQLRSILRRFADEAANARASFVYLDLPAVSFENRDYVLADGARPVRSTDLFTQGIPVMAFARTAAQAGQGGAVVMTVTAAPDVLPAGVSPMAAAPEAVSGASAIVVAESGQSDPIVQAVAAAGRQEAVEIGALLRRMTLGEGVSVSALPANPIFLRQPPQPEPAVDPITAALPTAAPAVPETLEELELLEQSLSRSAKRSIQLSLRDLGHYKGLIDGIFGPQTRQAITDYQAQRSETQTGVLSRRQLLDLKT